MKSESHMILFDSAALRPITQFLLLRLRRTGVTLEWRFITGYFTVEFCDLGDCLFNINFAYDRQNDIRGTVVLLYIRHDIVTRKRSQAGRGPDPPALHPMLLEGCLVEFFRNQCRWIVELPVIFLQND